jgi:Domain of unknown function (DUF4383)
VTARSLALVLGILYLGLGALGLMPGALAGLFPANPALAVVHLAMGAWGLAAYMGRTVGPTVGPTAAHSYARWAAFIFGALGLAGMVQGLDQFLMPLHGPNVWLHLASAGLAGFVAWRPRTGERRGLLGDRRRRNTASTAPSERRNGTYDRRKTPAAA